MIKQNTTLFFKEGSSDKVYQAMILSEADGYVVNFAYGRRGSALQGGTKTQAPVPLAKAEEIYTRLVAGKKAKGYKESLDGGETYTSVAPTDTGIRPQLLMSIEEIDLGHYMFQDGWWAQEKLDGRRRLVRKQNGVITAINRKGLAVAISSAILDRLREVPGDFILDGEDLGDSYIVFDRIEWPTLPYRDRLASLAAIGLDGPSTGSGHSPVTVLFTARSALEKQALLERLQSQRAEGIIFKHRNGAYTVGRTDSQVKLKFYATATVIVVRANAQRSVEIAVMNEGKETPVGNVTIPVNQVVPSPGSLVEVRYLYAYPGGSLYQPACLGQRDDVEADALCDLKFKPFDKTQDARDEETGHEET